MIQRAGTADPSEQRLALEEFCRAYWQPLFCYARFQRQSLHDAEDAVQSFFSRILDGHEETFENLDAEKGRLRSWLLTSFRNHLASEWNKDRAQKRGGNVQNFVPLGTQNAESRLAERGVPNDDRPEDLSKCFDREWAKTVMDRAQSTLREAHEKSGKASRFDGLAKFLTERTDAESAAAAAEALEMTPSSVRMAVSRLRDDFRIAIYAEIRDTVGIDVDVDEEFDYLLSCL